MSTEIEAKLKVDSLCYIERRLGEVGAEFITEVLQTDYYFDDACSSMRSTDRALRLRREVSENAERMFFTYKGPKAEDNFKKRQEIDLEVQDGELAEKLILALGYQRALVFQKKRRTWRLGDCIVALDQLPLLGEYVEIEGSNDSQIGNVQRSLGLENSIHITESYAILMERRLHQLNKKEKKVLF